MKRNTATSLKSRRKDLGHMSMEKNLYLMDELYWRAAQDGSLERYRRERKKGVEEVRSRWQLLRERLLPKPSTVAR